MVPKTHFRPILGIVFDGDDTLWSTEQLFDKARKDMRWLVSESGVDGAQWEKLERHIDVENVATMGFSLERFPTSCIQAYIEACCKEERPLDAAVVTRIGQVARSVFIIDPPVVSGAAQVLTNLRAIGVRLGLLTKGDPEVQRRRIRRSGLSGFFDVIEIVPEKNPDIIRAVVSRLGIDVEFACMVGNSVRSDLLPAVNAGLRAVWIDAHVWEYERACDHLVDARITILSCLADVVTFVAG